MASLGIALAVFAVYLDGAKTDSLVWINSLSISAILVIEFIKAGTKGK